MIYHLATRKDWNDALEQGAYTATSLEAEGFIHCSTVDQILTVANAFYLDAVEPLLLGIDEEACTAQVRWEPPAHPSAYSTPGELDAAGRFPHLYGPLNPDAVVEVWEMVKGADGLYRLPGRVR